MAVGSEVLAVIENVTILGEKGQQQTVKAGKMKLINQEFDRNGKPQKLTKDGQLELLNSITDKNQLTVKDVCLD